MKNIKMLFTIAIFVSLSFFCTDGMAEMKSGAFTLNPHIGGYIFEREQEINSDPVYGVGLGYNLTERWGIEAVFNFIDTNIRTVSEDTDVDVSLYRLDALYHFMLEEDVIPYLGAGLGAININKDPGESDTNTLFNWGGGIKYFVTETLAVRGDIRHIIDFDDTNSNLAYTLGLTFLFGGKEKELPPMDSDGDGINDDVDKCPGTPPGVPVDSTGCPKDSDSDGVYDHIDKCPNTPAGVSVDSTGCPLDSDGDGVYDYKDKCPDTPKGTPVDKNGCSKDSDGDGVYDNVDKCPGTPVGAPVDRVGCPLDSDNDGVYDYLDKCPGTPEGIKVDNKGCPVPIPKKVSIELKVKFDTNKAAIKPIYHDHIQEVANFLNAYPETVAVIEGHTDSTGSEEYNLKLSQKRANAVRMHLINNFNIPHWRLDAKGYGESRPIADNKTKEGKQLNRRVTAVISTTVKK